MKSTLIVLSLILAAISLSVTQAPDDPSPRLYELYSWPQSNGIWNFCLLPSPSGVNIPVEIIFDKKFRITGTDQLERKMSLLPIGTRIIWMNGITAGQTPTKESSNSRCRLCKRSNKSNDTPKNMAFRCGFQAKVLIDAETVHLDRWS